MRRCIWDKMILKNAGPAVLLVVLLFSSPVMAMSGGDYEITWSTIDGSGGRSTGGDYALVGTIGQPDAGEMFGGDYELLGGFLPGVPLCTVDFETFARFAKYWLETGTGLPADLYVDDTIDWLDMKVFADYWLCYCPLDWPLK